VQVVVNQHDRVQVEGVYGSQTQAEQDRSVNSWRSTRGNCRRRYVKAIVQQGKHNRSVAMKLLKFDGVVQ